MSWRTVVISSSAKLDYHMGYMVVRKDEEIKIHISEISILIIESTADPLQQHCLVSLPRKRLKLFFVMRREIRHLSLCHIMGHMIQVKK